MSDPRIALVIGNGFDLNLGLKTSYSDFISTKYDNKKENSIIDYIRRNKLNNTDWYSIEEHLAIISLLHKTQETLFKNSYSELVNDLHEYILHEQDNSKIVYDDLSNFVTRLIYKIAFKDDPKKFGKELLHTILNDIVIINFNYTNTVKKILNMQNDANWNNIHYDVHGNLTDKIVFGVNDKIKLEKKFTYLRKNFHTNSDKLKIFKWLYSANKIFFFGHSLGETDHSYFEDFLTL